MCSVISLSTNLNMDAQHLSDVLDLQVITEIIAPKVDSFLPVPNIIEGFPVTELSINKFILIK